MRRSGATTECSASFESAEETNQPADFSTTSWLDYLAYREQTETLTGLVAFTAANFPAPAVIT